MTVQEEHTPSESFEAINNTKTTIFSGGKVENNHTSSPIGESSVDINVNTTVDSRSNPRINQHVYVLDTIFQELQPLNDEQRQTIDYIIEVTVDLETA